MPEYPPKTSLDTIMSNINSQTNELKASVHRRQNELAGKYDAKDVYTHLQTTLSNFQSCLNEDQEIGVQLANFGKAAEIHIRSISFKNPNLIEFFGVLADGCEVNLIQHISQLSFMVIALKPIEDEPFRVGFVQHDK